MGDLSSSAMSLASTASAIDAFEVALNTRTSTLKKALDYQGEAVMQLLLSMDLGQNINLLA